jgi:hypothetical protein
VFCITGFSFSCLGFSSCVKLFFEAAGSRPSEDFPFCVRASRSESSLVARSSLQRQERAPVHQLVEFSDAQLRFSASVVARSEVVPRSCVDPVESSPGPVLAPTLRFFVRHWCSFLPPACNVSSSAPKHTVVSDFPARRLWHAACFSLGQMVPGCLHVSCSSVLLARFSVCLIHRRLCLLI